MMKNIITIILIVPILCFRASAQPMGKISYQSTEDRDIYTMDVDTVEKTRIANDIGFAVYASLSYDGSKIAFSTDPDDDRDKEIYIIDIKSGERRRLTNNPWNEEHPRWSPDGEWIAFTAEPWNNIGNGFPAIYRIRVDGTQQERVIQEARDSSWSPDGEWIVFNRYGDIYKVRVGSKFLVQITDDEFWYDYSPAFSPDGKRIVVVSMPPPGLAQHNIHVIDIDRNRRKKLTEEGFGEFPCWSPDGKEIAFYSAIADSIHVMDANGGDEIMLIENATFPSWSPCRPFAVLPHHRMLITWGALK